jgi:tetratricopeptide (TPR) repeat protein
MIQQTFISGQLGMAIYTDNRQRMVLNSEDLGRPTRCTGHDVSMFFHSGAEYSLLTGPVKDLQQLADSLERETRAHTALTLVLCGMDPSLDETRLLSIEAAEELLQDAYVHSFVKRRLLARPLPESADMEGARSGAASMHAPVLFALLGTVQQSQPHIQAVLQAWNQATREDFATPEEAADAESSLIELGAFADFVSAMAQESPEELNSLVIKFGLDRGISASLPRVTHLLNAMKNSLSLSLAHLADTRLPQKETAEEESSGGVRDLLSEFEEGHAGGSRKAMSPSRAKANVDVQLNSIGRMIGAHNLRRAEEWLQDLVEFQVSHGKKQHLAMSLCNLATIAIANREFDFAEILVGHAVALGIADPVIATIGGEISLVKGRFPEALQAFDEVIGSFPNDAVARTRRAEVLKAMGRFAGALQAYDEVIDLFPNDVVTRTGRAEVLKAMGSFAEALRAFDEVISLFPDNVIARNGRAEVLKAMGRFPEALQAYQDTIGLFPGDEVAWNGRAEVLKAMGNFAGALHAYDEAVGLFPGDAVARNGRAEVLKAMGRFPEALQAYQETRAQFPHDEYVRCGAASVLVLMNRTEEARALLSPEVPPVSKDDWVRYHILAMIYVKSGTNLDEAIRRLTHGSQHAPWQERQRFMNALAVAWIKRENYREALQVLQRDMEVLEALEKQKRLALIGHSYAATDAREEAIKALTGIANVSDPNLANLRGLLFERYSLGDQRVVPVNPGTLNFKIAQHEFALAMA